MICGIEWWAYISRSKATSISNKYNLKVSKGYKTKREFRIKDNDFKRTFLRSGKYECLILEVRRSDGKYILTVRGSLHKFYHGDNKGWFKGIEVLTAIQGLCDLFEIDSKDATVENLEVGINVHVPFGVYNYLNENLLYHKMKTRDNFDKKGVGFYFKHDDYWIKLYQKDHGLLRFEVKYKSQAKLDFFRIRKLSEFTETSINNLASSLIHEWNETILRGGIDIYSKQSWQIIMTKLEREKLSDFTSLAVQQSYKTNFKKGDKKMKELLRKQAFRLKSFCIRLLNDRGDKVHEQTGIQIKKCVQDFIIEWKE